MILHAFILENGSFVEQKVYNGADFFDRLNVELDTGTIQIINGRKKAFEDYSIARIVLEDSEQSEKTLDFYAFDTVEERGVNYYIHNLELVEPTRRLMGILIDGRKVTQPTTDDTTPRKTLYDVSAELLKVALLQDSDTADMLFTIAEQSKELLSAVISPEFHWEAETSLWECLCDIANVINCIPRLVTPSENPLDISEILFVPVNDVIGEYEL